MKKYTNVLPEILSKCSLCFFLFRNALKWLFYSWFLRHFTGWRQIHKIEQNKFSYGLLYRCFFDFLPKKHENLVFGWTVGNSSSNPNISNIFLKFLDFLGSSDCSRSETCEAKKSTNVLPEIVIKLSIYFLFV